MNSLVRRLPPPAKIGIIGGGQLGRLTAMEAKKLGYQITILDPASDCPAGQVADHQIVSSFSDAASLKALAETNDVLTYEFEHIDVDGLMDLENQGYRLIPSASCLARINDKYKQKQVLKDANIPVPLFFSVDELEFSDGLNRLGLPMVFKYRQGGYDGKGNIVAHTEAEALKTWNMLLGKNAMAEQYIPFERELSIIAAKDQAGAIALYPLAENYHKDGILRITKAPAQLSEKVHTRIKEIAAAVLSVLDSPGLFCIELFLDEDQNVFVNEIAPRPHNSGHHTLDACISSQYEQLLRILTGMPLGATDQISPCVMVNILGNESTKGEYSIEGMEQVLGIHNAHLYWYGKPSTMHLRKLGHVTVLDDSLEAAEQKAQDILQNLVLVPKR